MPKGASRKTISDDQPARRDRPGGPSKAALCKALDGYAATLNELITRQNTRKFRHAAAEKKLDKAFNSLMGT